MATTRKVRTQFQVVRDPLIARIRNGSPIKEACASVGIPRDTYYKWMQRGEAATSGEYRKFYEDVEKAKADSIMESILVVRKAAKDNWQAAAWWLERRCTEEFARQKVELEHTGGVTLTLKLEDCSRKEDLCNIKHATQSSSRRLTGPNE